MANTSSVETRSTAVRISAFSRWLYSFGASGEAFRVAEERGLSFTQMKVLLELGTRGKDANPYIQELAEHLATNMPSLSRGIDSLVCDGLITRVEDPEDRRRKRVSLTPEGKVVVEAFLAGRISGARDFVLGLEPDQRRLLDAAIDSLLDNDDFRQTYEEIEGVFPR